MGRRAAAKGEDPRDICLRLFRCENADLIKQIGNWE